MSNSTTLILELKKVQKSFRDNVVLDIRHLKFHKGTIYGIVGSAGCGKSSLMNILSGYETPNKGEALYDNAPFSKSFLGKPVSPEDLFLVNKLKVKKSLVSKLFKKSNANQLLSNYFTSSSAEKVVNTSFSNLSKGEKNAVLLTLGIDADPRLLLVDDYGIYFDNAMEQKFRKKIVSINKDHGTTVVLSSPNEKILKNFCSVLIYLDNGHISRIRTGSHKNPYNEKGNPRRYQNSKRRGYRGRDKK